MRTEEILIGLQKVSESDTQWASKASGLMGWYREKGDFTKKQRAYASNMIAQCSNKQSKAKSKDKTYCLYAIDDGVYIKLGYSCDPAKRMKTMQTGQANKLELLWQYPVGKIEVHAKKAERKLHRYCRRHSKRGEWFNRDCMTLVRQFEIHDKVHKERKEQEVELAILAEARERI
jgi:hypothetical protein